MTTVQGAKATAVAKVKRVWDRITDVQARFEAYVDPRMFEDLPDPVRFAQVDVDITRWIKTVVVLFLPIQKADFDKAIEMTFPSQDVDAVYMANSEIFEGWRAALERVQQEMDIVAVPTAVAEMARLACEALDARKPAETEEV